MAHFERVVIVGGKRTPFAKAGGALAKFTAKTLLAQSIQAAIQSVAQKFTPEEAFLGTVLLNPRFPNLARDAMFEAGLSPTITAHFVANNCITGLVAANMAVEAIRTGRISTAIAGGVESMSNPTLTYPTQTENAFKEIFAAKSLGDRVKGIIKLRPHLLAPDVPSPKEPSTGLTMGQHCELMVQSMGINRMDQDSYAAASHQKAAVAESSGEFAFERFALDSVTKDTIIRGDTTLERLSKLKPVFAKPDVGTLTAGNSSALTDGASIVCLASESYARHHNLPILSFIDAIEFAAIHPNDGLLMAPTLAIPKALRRMNYSLDDIDLFEIHEAFAGQVLCNLKGLENGFLDQAGIGTIPREKMNLHGGSLALGHPFAATGGRLLLSATHLLTKNNQKRALISACAAGGMGAAAILSR